MKIRLALLSLVVAASPAFAASDYEPFANATAFGGSPYNVGSPLCSGFTALSLVNATNATGGVWGCVSNLPGVAVSGIPVINSGNLSYTGLSNNQGNSLFIPSATGNMGRLTLPFQVSSGQAYYSFLLKVTDVSTLSSANSVNYFAGFQDTLGPQRAALGRAQSYLAATKSGSGYVLGIGKNSPTVAHTVYDTAVRNVGDTLLIVASYDYTATGHPAKLWINPDPSTFGAATPPTATLTTTNGTTELNSPGIQSFVLGCFTAAPPACVVDDLRVGLSWAIVTGSPDIQTEPAAETTNSGATATFSVFATGAAPLSYQWMRGATVLSDGGNIVGSSTSALSIMNCSQTDAVTYSVLVTNAYGSTNSSSATLTVNQLVADPAIPVEPVSVTNNYGTTATFSVGATGQSTLGYQWVQTGVGNLSDGGNVAGSSTSALTLSSVSYPNAGSYYVVVTDLNGSTNSATETLTVIEPIITGQSGSASVNQGGTTTFSVTAIGAPTLTYQWSKNGVAYSSDGGDVSGTQTSALTISPAATGDAGSYSVLVTDGSGMSAQSTNAVLTVLTAPAIASQLSPLTITPGNNATFAFGVTGGAPITFYWFSNNVAIPGATNFSYSVTNVQLGMSGQFYAIASNALGTATSGAVSLTVVPNIHLYSTNLVVVRVGNGAEPQDFTGSSVFLDQYTTNGTYLNTVCIPDSGSSALLDIAPDVNGTTITGTALSLSGDGLELVLSGYNTPWPHNGVLFSSTSTSTPRGVGMVNSQGHFVLPISDKNAFSATYYRGAASDGTNNYWGAGNTGGTYYFGLSAPATNVQSIFANLRSTSIFNGNLYAVSGSSGGIAILGWTGLPTNTVTPQNLFIPGATPTDMALDPTGTIMYLGTSSGIMKYTLGGSWTYQSTITGYAIRYLTADFTQNPPVIYATTSDSSYDHLIRVVDDGSSAEQVLMTVGVNQNFRGIRFGPGEPYFNFTNAPGNIVLSWDGYYTLQSSTNAASGYADIPTATTPYTNAFTNANQTFFRLRQ
jgi:hypothetical protein